MKLKIIFSEPTHTHTSALGPEEQRIVIQSPYKLSQTKPGDERVIQREDGNRVTYEVYCVEMKQLIENAIKAAGLDRHGPFDACTIEGFYEPPLFNSLCNALKHNALSFASSSKLFLKDCQFGGAFYVNALKGLIQKAQKKEGGCCNIYLEDKGKSRLTVHDEANLASIEGVSFHRSKNARASTRPFTDDSLLGVIKSPLISQFEHPSYLYRQGQSGPTTTLAEKNLKAFFSQAAQQQNDYTCAPATLRMMADYYETMHNQGFCGEPVSNLETWHTIKIRPEMELAARIKTNEADGSAPIDVREGLIAMGLAVVDDTGLSNRQHTDSELNAHKELLWSKMKEILALGIPLLLNMRDRDGCGHYEVVIGIESKGAGEQIIFAEPGTALAGALEFEVLAKEQFLPRWKNMTGEFHGRFLILPPNQASLQAVEKILAGVPHYLNGEGKHRLDLSQAKPLIHEAWKEEDYRKSQKAKFIALLEPLQKKLNKPLSAFPKAKAEAQGIVEDLTKAANSFYNSSPTKESFNLFEQRCNDAFKPEKTTQLQEHRKTLGKFSASIKHFFVALKKKIFGKDAKHIKFFDSRTESAKMVDKLQQDVAEIKKGVFKK